jgi:L-arabinokinase
VDLSTLQPAPRLLSRARDELAFAFDFTRPMRLSRAPAHLDVMGGVAECTGSLVCQYTLDCAAAVLLQRRADRQLQIFSFNLFDEQFPFTFNISIDHLAQASARALRSEFSSPGRGWAGHVAGCLYLLHQNQLIDLKSPSTPGLNLALLSTIPSGAGLGSSTALEVATMVNLIDYFALRDKFDEIKLASMCHLIKTEIIGAPGGIAGAATSSAGEQGSLSRMICQPREIQPTLPLPSGVRLVGIDSKIRDNARRKRYDQSRCAAFMGHTIIVNKMREMGQAAGRALLSDPMNGYLANLDPDDYKRLFRPYLPESIDGGDFLANFGPTIDTATMVDPKSTYAVLGACDHHVLEAKRAHRFADLIAAAAQTQSGFKEQGGLLDKAGHLMYASHLSYTNDAKLGADECDLLVKLVRDRESAGLYGARITGPGCGGTVAVLCDSNERAEAAIAQILLEYERQTGNHPQTFLTSTPGAWITGTTMI